ncbi:MAG: hypothetical protein WDO69_32800 [Pseudomonadota bacterium]
MFHSTRWSVSLTALLLGSMAAACAAPAAHLPPTASAATPIACPGGTVRSAADAAKYAACDSVVGDLSIRGSDLTHLAPLARLRSVSGTLEISDNPRLDDLSGLERLSSVGGLEISNNRALDGILALRQLESAGTVSIRDNAGLDTLQGLEGLATLQSLSIEHNGIYNTAGLENLHTVGSVVVNRNSKLISLAGLKALRQAKSIEIRNNPLLAAYFGLLPQLARVDEQLVLRSNDGLAEHEVREVFDRVGHGSFTRALAKHAQGPEVSLR